MSPEPADPSRPDPAGPSSAAGSTGAEDAAAHAGLPPLVDRGLFFGDPKIAAAEVSPDGRFLAFVKPFRGVLNVWVKTIEEPFSAARPLTADRDRPVTSYFWSRDGRWVLYVQDKGGDENFHLRSVDPEAPADPETGVPPARDLTPLEGVQVRVLALPRNRPGEVILALNERDPAHHDVFRLDLESGERELLAENAHGVADWVVDRDGEVRLAVRETEDAGTEVVLVEEGGSLGRCVAACSFEETVAPARFHRDARRVYLITNASPPTDLTRLVLLDVETGEVEDVESDPEGEVDVGGALFSEVTDELVATFYFGDRQRFYPRDEGFREFLAELRRELPDGELAFTSRTRDERLWTVSVSRDVDPGSVYLVDRDAGSAGKLYTSRPELPTEHMAPMRPVRYRARDGREIPAYLTAHPPPPGEAPRPALLIPHGGPWARDFWGWDPLAQFFANRGYAVLQPNFRGSTGFGKEFLNAGNGEWGDAMQDDLTDGVAWLAEEGLADPERVGILGGSYGGYAVLAGLAFTPDLYAAGVSIVGPSSLLTLLDSIPPYWGPVRRLFSKRVGDPDDPEERARLERQSPLFSADRMRAPLLVVQGANDPRVKRAESEQIVAALREHGRDVEYLLAGDEGHGFAGKENRLAMFTAAERFLARHLGGRWQEEMEPELAERLEALRQKVSRAGSPG